MSSLTRENWDGGKRTDQFNREQKEIRVSSRTFVGALFFKIVTRIVSVFYQAIIA